MAVRGQIDMGALEDDAINSSMTDGAIMDKHGIEELEELEEILLDMNIERCAGCDRWHYSFALEQQDDGRLLCEACRGEE